MSSLNCSIKDSLRHCNISSEPAKKPLNSKILFTNAMELASARGTGRTAHLELHFIEDSSNPHFKKTLKDSTDYKMAEKYQKSDCNPYKSNWTE